MSTKATIKGLASRRRAMSLYVATVRETRVGSGRWRDSDDSHGDDPSRQGKQRLLKS
jgi:hypothetical protein